MNFDEISMTEGIRNEEEDDDDDEEQVREYESVRLIVMGR